MKGRLEAAIEAIGVWLAGLREAMGGKLTRPVPPGLGLHGVRAAIRGFVPAFVRRRYALKFGIGLFILGMLVALIGIGATVQFSDQVKQNTDDVYAQTAATDAENLEGWNEHNRELTRVTALSDVIQNGDAAFVKENIHQLLNDLPTSSANIHYVDTAGGTVLASTDPSTQSAAVSSVDAPWTEMVPRETLAVDVTDGYRSASAENRPVLAYVVAVPGQDDRALVHEVRLKTYGRFLQAPETRGQTMVVDGEGKVLFEDSNSQLLTPYAEGTSPVVQAAANQPVGTGGSIVIDQPTGALSADGSPLPDSSLLVGFARVPGTNWVVLFHGPTNEAYRFANAITLWGAVATLAGVLMVTLVGTILGRNASVSIDRLTEKTRRMEEGDLSVDFETDRIDNIGRLYEAFGSMRDALRENIDDARAARQEAEEARERAETMTEHLVEKADEYSEVMEAVADGDLTRRMDPQSRNEAMGEIAREFNEMIEEIEGTTQDVKEFATEVATSSEEVTASSEEVKSSSEQVTESIQEISAGAERQNDQLQAVAEEMNSLSTTVEEIAASANEVADLSQQTAETGDAARESAEEAISEMESVEDEAAATVAAMEQLQTQMEQIEEITEFITDVAEQTNILALNANIEAARAGEAGSGFAVVADEVKSLAEETRDAAEEIDALVENVHDQTETTAEEVQGTSEVVARSVETVEETVDSLEEIAGYAEETNTGIQGISDATTEQASSTNQVVGMVDDAASIAEQTSQESENVAAAAEEQTTALTEVTQSVSDLTQQASRLSSTLERFDTEADVPQGTDPEGAVSEPPGGAEPDVPGGDEREATDAVESGAAEPTGDSRTEESGAGEDDVSGERSGDAEPSLAEVAVPEVETDSTEDDRSGVERDPAGEGASGDEAAEVIGRGGDVETDDDAGDDPAEPATDADTVGDEDEAQAEPDAPNAAATNDAPVEVVPEAVFGEWLDAQTRTPENATDADTAESDAEDD